MGAEPAGSGCAGNEKDGFGRGAALPIDIGAAAASKLSPRTSVMMWSSIAKIGVASSAGPYPYEVAMIPPAAPRPKKLPGQLEDYMYHEDMSLSIVLAVSRLRVFERQIYYDIPDSKIVYESLACFSGVSRAVRQTRSCIQRCSSTEDKAGEVRGDQD
jgi:hypothetical protein